MKYSMTLCLMRVRPSNLAKILKTVKHENIVTCYRMFKTSSKLYIVYGYEEGTNLD